MTKPDDTIRVLIPLKVRKKNGRPKILPPADYLPSEDQTQDPHILRAIARAWGWRRRMDTGEFSTIQELAEAVGLAERHVSRQLRLAYLAPEVLKRLTCGREPLAVSLYDLCFLAGRLGGNRCGGRFAQGHNRVSIDAHGATLPARIYWGGTATTPESLRCMGSKWVTHFDKINVNTCFKVDLIARLECECCASCAAQRFRNLRMGCNANNHPPGCDCGFGGDTGGGFFVSNYWGAGNVPLPQNALRQVTFNTTCPLCGEPCYYYENEFGSKVWFDELGVPWTKHPCFDRQPDLHSTRPREASDFLLDLEPTVHRVFSKRLWQTGNWHFFAVLKDKQNIPRLHPWEQRKAMNIAVEDHERAIGHFIARHPVDNGLFSLISWKDGAFFAIPNDAAETFQIFPTDWRNSAFDRTGSLQIQRKTDCFRQVLKGAESISDPQDRVYFADLLYDQTDLPIETIAFLARVPLIEAIKISNGDAKPAYVKNRGKARRVAAEIADCLYYKPQRS